MPPRGGISENPKELDLAQSAMLAGLIRAPSALAPSRNLKAAERRARVVLRAMLDSGAIDRAQYERRAPSRSLSRSRPNPSPARTIFWIPPTPR